MRGPLLPLFACLLAVAACKKQQPQPLQVRVTRIVVNGDTVAPPDPAAPGPDGVVAAAERGLARASVPVLLAPSEPMPGDFQLRLQVQVQELAERPPATAPQPPAAAPPPAKPTDAATGTEHLLRVLCAGNLTARGISAFAGEGDGEPAAATGGPPRPELTKFEHIGVTERKLAAGQPSPAELAPLVERLVEDSAQTLGAELHLLGSDSRTLVALVGRDGDPELRQTAMQILGRRKERLALPVLIAVIKERDIPAPDGSDRQRRAERKLLRDAAIGALVAIGDRSAVRPLLDSVAFRDYSEMGKVLEAVALLGGDEARSYLQFVKGSHPEPAIRDEAEAALRHLERRRAGAKDAAAGDE